MSSLVSSTPTTNEIDRDKSDSGALSPVPTLNEDQATFTPRAVSSHWDSDPSTLRTEISHQTSRPYPANSSFQPDPTRLYHTQKSASNFTETPHSPRQEVSRSHRDSTPEFAKLSLGHDSRPFKTWLPIAENSRRDAKITTTSQRSPHLSTVRYSESSLMGQHKISQGYFAMSTPPIFSLSNQLLNKIISNLGPKDIFACRGTCRQLNDLIVNSQLIQYIIRTALSGVYDPLDTSLSLPERLVALQRWETAWQEIDLRESDACIDPPVPTGCASFKVSFGRYFIVINQGYHKKASYSFLDMDATYSSQHTPVACWTTIKIDTPNVLVFAFASELDLVVAMSCASLSLTLSFACSHIASSSSLPHFSHAGFILNWLCRLIGHPTCLTAGEQR